MVKYASMNVNGFVEIKSVDKQILESGSVLLSTLFSEVCGTDVHLMHSKLAGVPYPIIPGHVSTGKIIEVNGTVQDVEGVELKIGDIVTFLDVHETCNSCWYCLVAKETTRCPKRKVYGITYSSDDGLLGGWSQQIYLKPGVKILRLNTDEEARIFMAGGCGLPTAIHAIQRANIQLGQTVTIQGSGPVGLMAAILAKHRGAFKVILIGGPEHRLKIAKSFGIDVTIDISAKNADQRLQEVLEETQGRGSDIVIEATGVASAVKEGMNMSRDGGTYVIVGQYTNAGEVPINPHLEINKKHLTVKGCWGSDFSHFYLAVRFMQFAKDKYDWDQIISREYSLEDTTQALKDVENYSVMKALIKPN